MILVPDQVSLDNWKIAVLSSLISYVVSPPLLSNTCNISHHLSSLTDSFFLLGIYWAILQSTYDITLFLVLIIPLWCESAYVLSSIIVSIMRQQQRLLLEKKERLEERLAALEKNRKEAAEANRRMYGFMAMEAVASELDLIFLLQRSDAVPC